MLEVIELYFLLFISYAFLGWCMEVICKLIQYKRFINRGFLIGPYCPIYGWGALLITILLQKYNNDPLTLFILAMVICLKPDGGIIVQKNSILTEEYV